MDGTSPPGRGRGAGERTTGMVTDNCSVLVRGPRDTGEREREREGDLDCARTRLGGCDGGGAKVGEYG